MFALAFLIGIYGNIIFVLGLSGLLNSTFIFLVSLLMLIVTVVYFKKKILAFFGLIKSEKIFRDKIFRDRFPALIVLLLILQFIVNLIGALSPELAFDALWYHLTLPKIYLLNNSIFHIPGGLLYYSDMPKLTELLYTLPLTLGNEVYAKLIQLIFGVLTSVAIYKISRKFVDRNFSLIAVLIFYSNLVVAWQSTTAYVDLSRAFFEVLALWGFITWLQTKKRMWLVESAFLLGLAMETKILAIFSLLIFSILIILKKDLFKEKIKNLGILWAASIIVIVPWLIFSYVNTGNPMYPFFSSVLNPGTFSLSFLNPINFVSEVWKMFVTASDPVSPLYLIFLPLIILKLSKSDRIIKNIGIYVVMAVILNVSFIPQIKGGTRFILPYLPAFSILIAYIIFNFKKHSSGRVLAISLILIISVSTILFRGYATLKYLPYIFGQESKANFLTQHLNFSYGDFYDTDGFFAKNIKSSDKVLLVGFHNLYYVNFPFIDQSWAKKGDNFNYVAIQDAVLPDRYKSWNIIYFNPITKVQLFTAGRHEWTY